MNGAQALIRTLTHAGIDACFTNPGTSEMHFVAALDSVPQMRPVLCLFEGVATGAADGYGRMKDLPGCTLLHLGPGLTNGLANVHNARRARSPMLNVVGDHATYHKRFDAPLNSDIEGLAAPLSDFVRVTSDPTQLARDTAEAAQAAASPPGQIATLVLPADVSWSEAGEPASRLPPPERDQVRGETIDAVANALRSGEPSVLLMDGQALREAGLQAARRAADKVGARLMADTFTGRLQRGAGRAVIERFPYFAEMAAAELQNVKHLVLVGSKSPVSFFAYPDKPSDLVADGCQVHTLATPEQDAISALEALAEALGADKQAALAPLARPQLPQGALDGAAIANAIGALLPEGAVVVDEGNTEGIVVPLSTVGSPPHDWLSNPGGSIGMGLPVGTGAAVACPDRKVVCLQADGSAMYTIQALWTQARENLDVTTVLFANRSYRILNIELMRVGAEGAGERARSMLDISNPTLDFVALAQSMGVEASRPDSAEAFVQAFERSMKEPGPSLIECVL